MKAEHLGADCSNCPLRDEPMVPSKKPVMLTEGPRIAVVGEAPGQQEVWRKVPFTGPSGKLMDRVLEFHNLDRREMLLTNACLCRPEDNATPPQAAIIACRPRLDRELVANGITDIIAVGNTAAKAVMDDPRGITTLRVGPPKKAAARLQLHGEVRVVPTWHPAYCLRTADAFPSLVADVGKVLSRGTNVWSPPDWFAYDDPDDALAAIAELRTIGDRVCVDIEVGVEKDFSFSHPNQYDLLCVGLGYARGKVVVVGEAALKDRRVRDALGAYLRERRIIAHNGKFDLGGLYPHLGGLRLWADTMLASYALDERPGNHGLKVLAIERLGAPQYDTEIKKYLGDGKNYAAIPRPLLYKYNAYDVACTWELWELFEQELERSGQRRAHDHMVAASNELMFLELNGITIDREYSSQLTGEYLQELELIEAKLDDIVRASSERQSINPRSPKQVKEYLATQGVKVASTDKETLGYLLASLPGGTAARAFVDTLTTHRRRAKLYGTYVDGIRRRTYRGRVYTTYLLHGSTSGRLASRNPNLQNIVRDNKIRQQFSVSKPGNVLIQADYKQAEGRVIAWQARDEYLRNVFTSGVDLFNTLAGTLYGVDEPDKEQRIRVKAFFYGLSFGRSAYSIGQEFGLSPREADKLYDDFMGLIPATARWQEETKRKVLKGEPLRTPFGRRRQFFLITDQNKKDVFNEALSYVPQSTASDICLTALVRLRPMLRGLGFIRLTIHDALVVECAQDAREEVSALLRETMVGVAAEHCDYVPFAVDVSYGTHWGEL